MKITPCIGNTQGVVHGEGVRCNFIAGGTMVREGGHIVRVNLATISWWIEAYITMLIHHKTKEDRAWLMGTGVVYGEGGHWGDSGTLK